jgi:hypothetical protein
VPLRLPALGTTVLAFRKGESAGRHAVSTSPVHETVATAQGLELRDLAGGVREIRFSDGSTSTVTLPEPPAPVTAGGWNLHVDAASAAGTTPIDVALDELKDWREIPQLARVSGKAVYTTTVNVGAGWPGAYLDLGRVAGSVEVFVNGAKVAPDTVAGREWDVTSLLRPGANAIKVELATPLGNGLGRDAEAYGLLGPVRLLPFSRAALAWSAGSVGGTVPATLSLSVGNASFGPFTPGVAKEYTAQTAANVISTAGDATLSVSDPGRLTNGAFSLAQPLRVAFSKSTWTAPVSNDPVTVTFTQAIGASEPLRTGTYSRTLTFTLATTSP